LCPNRSWGGGSKSGGPLGRALGVGRVHSVFNQGGARSLTALLRTHRLHLLCFVPKRTEDPRWEEAFEGQDPRYPWENDHSMPSIIWGQKRPVPVVTLHFSQPKSPSTAPSIPQQAETPSISVSVSSFATKDAPWMYSVDQKTNASGLSR
jgi:hypothetical protein